MTLPAIGRRSAVEGAAFPRNTGQACSFIIRQRSAQSIVGSPKLSVRDPCLCISANCSIYITLGPMAVDCKNGMSSERPEGLGTCPACHAPWPYSADFARNPSNCRRFQRVRPHSCLWSALFLAAGTKWRREWLTRFSGTRAWHFGFWLLLEPVALLRRKRAIAGLGVGAWDRHNLSDEFSDAKNKSLGCRGVSNCRVRLSRGTFGLFLQTASSNASSDYRDPVSAEFYVDLCGVH